MKGYRSFDNFFLSNGSGIESSRTSGFFPSLKDSQQLETSNHFRKQSSVYAFQIIFQISIPSSLFWPKCFNRTQQPEVFSHVRIANYWKTVSASGTVKIANSSASLFITIQENFRRRFGSQHITWSKQSVPNNLFKTQWIYNKFAKIECLFRKHKEKLDCNSSECYRWLWIHFW